MSRGSWAAVIAADAVVLLDTSAVLAYLSGTESASAAAATIVDDYVATGRNRGLVSAITLTEALVRPLRAGSPSAVRAVEDFLLRFPNIRVEPVSVDVAREAARIRAVTAAPTPDALILATATQAGADVVVAKDQSWPSFAKRAGLSLQIALLHGAAAP